MIALLQRMRRFNPAKAKKTTFIVRIVERHIATLLEARHAQCRDWRLCRVSLNTPHENDRGDTRELIDRVDSEGALRPCQPDTRESEINSLRMDVARVLDTLPEDLRDLCERLRESNMADIARETGVSRTTLYDKLTRSQENKGFREIGAPNPFLIPTTVPTVCL